jgi:hypothetical protein
MYMVRVNQAVMMALPPRTAIRTAAFNRKSFKCQVASRAAETVRLRLTILRVFALMSLPAFIPCPEGAVKLIVTAGSS